MTSDAPENFLLFSQCFSFLLNRNCINSATIKLSSFHAFSLGNAKTLSSGTALNSGINQTKHRRRNGGGGGGGREGKAPAIIWKEGGNISYGPLNNTPIFLHERSRYKYLNPLEHLPPPLFPSIINLPTPG